MNEQEIEQKLIALNKTIQTHDALIDEFLQAGLHVSFMCRAYAVCSFHPLGDRSIASYTRYEIRDGKLSISYPEVIEWVEAQEIEQQETEV